jgi:ribosome-associated toxin RatA of RatAB toxin-antitoxin module
MYRLVNDVESYPAFFPFCREVEVLGSSATELVARIRFAKGPVGVTLTTRNSMVPASLIDIELVEGPFRHFSGHWKFEDLGDAGTLASFDLDFEVSVTGLLGIALGKLFDEIAGSLVQAYCRRADVVYGGA